MKMYLVSYQAVHQFKRMVDAEDEDAAVIEAQRTHGDALWTGVFLANFKAEEITVIPDAP